MAVSSTTPLETVMESPGWNPYDAGAADGVTAGEALITVEDGEASAVPEAHAAASTISKMMILFLLNMMNPLYLCVQDRKQ